ncbi:MAG: UvrD-helicase domain-containing protein [Desulfovibrio sp.]|nr:UvrD-helicase domain-containing protein [Desulfovibrio sp.]
MITRIKASAGSGKTYTLTQNFLELLYKADPDAPASACALHGRPDGYALQEILAATFTNKAAAEMKDRVLTALKQEALRNLAVPADARRGPAPAEQWIERILRRYGNLNIRTIDSLLTTLARLSALELGLPPDFEPSFDADDFFTPYYDALTEDLAADETNETERTDKRRVFHTADAGALRAALRSACKSLLSYSSVRGFTLGDRLHDPLLELVAFALPGTLPTAEEDGDSGPARYASGPEALPSEEAGIGDGRQGCRPEMLLPTAEESDIFARINSLHAPCKTACAELLELIERENLNVNAHYLRFLRNCTLSAPGENLPSEIWTRKGDFDDCLNKASKGAASENALRAFGRAKDALGSYAENLPVLRHALRLAPLCRLAGELCARMKADKTSKLLPALLLPRLTAGLMSGATGVSDALCRLGTRISRILLDEFQDTSREQWEAVLPLAVEALATGGSLTLVGDAKQAVYGWRGGDAALFDEIDLSPDLRRVGGEPKTLFLTVNRRSRPRIVEHNNAFFSLLEERETAAAVMSALLPEDTPDIHRQAAAAEVVKIFSGVRQQLPPDIKTDTANHKTGSDGRPRSEHTEVVLYTVEETNAAAVEDVVGRRLRRLFTEELPARWEYGDIAVLVRTGEEAEYIADLLTQRHIPVVTENSFRLFAHPLVGKLISFLTFLDYPPDDAAFMECVSGPELAGGYAEHDPQSLLAWAAESAFSRAPSRPPLYTLFRARFPALWASLFEPFYAEAGFMSAYDLLAEIVRRFDLERRREDDLPFVRRLLELAHVAEQQGCVSPAAFLAFCRKRNEDEKLPMPENTGAVRVMTIHKAKGLEFPVVVLPFQHKQTPFSPKVVRRACLGLDLATREVRELPDLHYPARVREELERLNLLYVAWTRPVCELHAFLTNPGTRPGEAVKLLAGIYREKYGDRFCRWEHPSAEDHAAPARAPDATQEQAGTAEAASAPTGAPGAMPKQTGVPGVTQEPAEAPGTTSKQAGTLDTTRDPAGAPGATPGSSPLPSLPWRPMQDWPRLKIFRSHPEAAQDEEGPGDAKTHVLGSGLTARERGVLLHLCLEHLHLPRGGGRGTVEEAVARAAVCALRLFPPPLEQAESVAAELRAALLRFAALPDAAAWLACGLREQSIMDEQGKVYRTDLLVDMRALGRTDDDADGGLLVLDYKSGAYRESHMLQMRHYMRLLAGASGRPTRGLIVYLDGTLLPVDEEHAA